MKRTNRLLLATAMIFLSMQSYAGPTLRYLVRSPGVSLRQYNAYLLTDPSASAIVAHIKKSPADSSALESLKTEFEKAQVAYLNSEDEAMRTEWLNLASFAYKADWPKPYRAMISIGFLRLAQVSTSADDTKKWLTIAAGFDASYEPDRTLFPPPLVAEYHEIRAAQQKFNVPIQNWKNFELALLNGKAIRLSGRSTLSLPDQTVRLTLLSSVYQPVTRVLPARALIAFQPRRLPWVTGTCQTPLWSELENTQQNLAALFSNSCVAVRGQSQPIFPLSTPTLASGSLETPAYNQWADPSTAMATPSNSKPFYKSGWFWLGAAIAAGAIVYSQERNAGAGGAAATHTSGF